MVTMLAAFTVTVVTVVTMHGYYASRYLLYASITSKLIIHCYYGNIDAVTMLAGTQVLIVHR